MFVNHNVNKKGFATIDSKWMQTTYALSPSLSHVYFLLVKRLNLINLIIINKIYAEIMSNSEDGILHVKYTFEYLM